MSDVNNPYQGPEADVKIEQPLISQGALTEIMVKYLNDASPWLRFMGIMGFIGSGFMALAGIVSIFSMPFVTGVLSGVPDIFSDFISPLSIMTMYGTYFIGAGALMFFPALFTYRFGTKIRSFVLTNSAPELELALRNNSFLWKFRGILMIVGLAVIPVIVIIVIVVVVAFMAIG